MSKQLQNFYKQTLSLDWSIGTGTFYVTVKPTISDGWLVISPNNSNLREIVRYTTTGTDANGDYVGVTERGVGGTTEQTHTVGEPIRMNITAEYWNDMNTDIANIVAAGVPNANTTTMGGVQEATAAEIDAGTQTGGTGAELFINPKLLNDAHNIPLVAPSTSGNLMTSNGTDWVSSSAKTLQHTIGAQSNDLVKTYFNIQLPFTLWTGSTSGALTTDFLNWSRSSTDINVLQLGLMVDFINTGAEELFLETFLYTAAATTLKFNATNTIILDWWAKLPATGTGDINMGFSTGVWDCAHDATGGVGSGRVVISQNGTDGKIYATIFKTAVGITNTEITGVTVTNWNNYRIELDLSNNALFYVNGVLKATLSGANLPTAAETVQIGFGRSDTSLFQITAPTLSLEMNP